MEGRRGSSGELDTSFGGGNELGEGVKDLLLDAFIGRGRGVALEEERWR